MLKKEFLNELEIPLEFGKLPINYNAVYTVYDDEPSLDIVEFKLTYDISRHNTKKHRPVSFHKPVVRMVNFSEYEL